MSDDGGPAASPGPAGAGWYPDPWHAASRRYWTGTEWTSLAFPDRTVGEAAGAAARAGVPDPFATRPAPPPAPPPPPAWVGPDRTPRTPSDAGSPTVEVPRRTGSRVWPVLLSVGAVLVAVALLLGFVVARGPGRSAAAPAPSVATTAPLAPAPSTSPPAPAPGTTPPPGRAEIDLARLGLRQSDVDADVLVLPIAGGLQVAGQVTLDLCEASYPSESLRRERAQVAAYDLQGSATLSTEAVRYADTGAVAQAWAEIQQAAARCSSTQPGAQIAPGIDRGWPRVAGVQRLAYDLTTTDADGAADHSVVVYLSRGNVLLGVYFPSPDGPQTAVEGRTTIAGIVDVFARRLAALPPEGLTGSAPAGVGPTA